MQCEMKITLLVATVDSVNPFGCLVISFLLLCTDRITTERDPIAFQRFAIQKQG